MIKFSTYSTIKKKLSYGILVLLAYLRFTTTKRLCNAFVLMLSYGLNSLFNRQIINASSIAVSIEPISVCNLKCPECPTGLGILVRSKGMLSLSKYKFMLSQLGSSTWHVNLYFQGEPFMHPNLAEMVSETRKKGFVSSTSTNGQFMNKEQSAKIVKSGLDLIIISFDAVSQDVYNKYRIGGEFYKVVEATRNLIEAKKEQKSYYPLITAQFLVFKHNEHQVADFVKLANALGVDKVDIKTAQVYDSPKAKDRLPSIKKYSRYKLNTDGKLDISGTFKNKCWKAWSSSVITWDGSVLPCCFDKDADNNFGNIFDKNIREIRLSSKFKGFQTSLLNNQANIDICINCPFSKK